MSYATIFELHEYCEIVKDIFSTSDAPCSCIKFYVLWVLGVEGLSNYGFNVVGGRFQNFFKCFASDQAIKVFSKHIMWPQWEEETLPKGEFVDTGIIKHVFFFTWGGVYEHQSSHDTKDWCWLWIFGFRGATFFPRSTLLYCLTPSTPSGTQLHLFVFTKLARLLGRWISQCAHYLRNKC